MWGLVSIHQSHSAHAGDEFVARRHACSASSSAPWFAVMGQVDRHLEVVEEEAAAAAEEAEEEEEEEAEEDAEEAAEEKEEEEEDVDDDVGQEV